MINPYGDNFIPVIPGGDPIHTVDNPFCSDPTCPCHDDPDSIDRVADLYTGGLITADHATDIVNGKMPL